MPSKSDYKEHIEFAKQMIAEALNKLDAADERLGYVFENRRDWNSIVKYQVQEGATQLGFALACLTTWFDNLEEEKEENK